MTRTCPICQTEFTFKHPRATYCSTVCRVRASERRRAAEAGSVQPVRKKPGPKPKPKPPVEIKESDARQPVNNRRSGRGPVESAVYKELKAFDAVQSSDGQLVLAMARRADSGGELGSGLTSITRQISATMKEIEERSAPQTVDPVDELRAMRDRKHGFAS